MTVQDAAQATLDRLREVGWSKGPRGPNGEECVGTAAGIVTAGWDHRACRLAFYAAILKEAGLRGPFARADRAYDGALRWNDDPLTTWQDVERVLTEIAQS